MRSFNQLSLLSLLQQALPYVCLLIAMLFFIYAIIGMQVSFHKYITKTITDCQFFNFLKQSICGWKQVVNSIRESKSAYSFKTQMQTVTEYIFFYLMSS